MARGDAMTPDDIEIAKEMSKELVKQQVGNEIWCR